MTKCGVWISRKRSAGSKRAAPRAVADPKRQRRTAAISGPRTRLRSAGLGVDVSRITRGAREHDAEDECGHTQEAGADEEQSVRLGQRAAAAQRIDPYTGKALRELSYVGVRRA